MANKNDDVKIVDAHGNEYQHNIGYGLTAGKAKEIATKLNSKRPRNIYDKHWTVKKIER